jgi:hypothetical protein
METGLNSRLTDDVLKVKISRQKKPRFKGNKIGANAYLIRLPLREERSGKITTT